MLYYYDVHMRTHMSLAYVGTMYYNMYNFEEIPRGKGGKWEQVYNNYIIMMYIYIPILYRTTQGERTVSIYIYILKPACNRSPCGHRS